MNVNKEKMESETKQKQFTLADAKIIGDKLGVDWDIVDVKEFRLGMNAELADGAYSPLTNFVSNDPILIGKVVRMHLNEAPDYYTQWAQMEKAAARKRGGKRVNDQAAADESE